MMTGATFAQERADSGELSEEDKRKEAATMLTMTKLMDQITRSMGGDGIDPALKLMLTAVANPSENVTVRVVPIETVPDDIARM